MAISKRHQDWDVDCKVYIGGLRSDCNKYDLEDAFSEFGKVLSVWIAQRPPGFGFILFEDARDAKDSVRALDGAKVCGYRVKVEMAKEMGGRGRRSRSRSRDRKRSPRRRSRTRSPARRRDRSRSRDRKRGSRRRSRSDSD